MNNGQYQSERARAWLLLRAKEPKKVAESIYNEYGKRGFDDFVVIRVDVVEGEYNIVVPIDTMEEHFETTENMITSFDGVTSHATLRVTHFNPGPTYLAHGFIQTTEKVALDNKWLPPDEEGRVEKNSPGDNPWG